VNAIDGSVGIQPSNGFRRLISNASAMVGSSALNSALGFVYWFLAARLYADHPEVVGFTNALVPLMMGLGSLAMLGLGNTLVGELPQMPQARGRLLGAALITSSLAGVLIGSLTVLIAPMFSNEFLPLRQNPALGLIFACGVGLTSSGQILDEALLGILRGPLQLWRNALFSVLKLGLLIALGLSSLNGAGSIGLFGTWVLALAGSFGLLALTMRVQGIRVLIKPDFAHLWTVRRLAFGHHAINLAYLGTGSILPLMVTAMFGVKLNASFYNAWMLTGFGFVVPYALATVLHAMSAANIKALAIRLRSSVGVSSLIVTAYGLLLFFGAQSILGAFGKNYLGAAVGLQIMAFALLPMVIKTHFMTLGRIRNQLGLVVRYAAVGTVLELILAVLGAQAGLSGLCLGYVIALWLEAAYALPSVYVAAFPGLANAIDAEDLEASSDLSPVNSSPVNSNPDASNPGASNLIGAKPVGANPVEAKS
jgi:O-antigen/teichoic acid export membrane protein